MGATGYVLTIPKDVLDKLEKADAKINQIAESSEKTEVRFKNAFYKMANYVDPLLNKLEALKGLGNLRLDKTFKSSATDAEKAASGIAQVATQLNKVAESPVDALNKKLESMRKLMEETKSASERLATATSKGVISRDVLSGGNTASALMPEIQGQIRVLELERAELQQNDRYWKQYIENMNGSSLAAQKQKAEMERLNSSFRTGSSEMQKRAKEEAELAKQAEKLAAAQNKAAQAEQKKNAARSNAANAAAVRAEEQYARALNKSEVTITQRARKIEALANAQRALTQTGKQYTAELAKITSETQRLQKANDGAAKSMTKLKSNQSSVLNTTDQLTRKIALLFSVAAIQGYVDKLISVRGEFELQNRALQSILQNKDQADEIWSKTVQLAVRSPFTVKELVTYTKQLAAYRIEADKLYDTNKMLADVSAGLGVSMDRLILAFGQVKAANYLRASEVRQFTEAGVNILGELATYYSELEGKMVSVGDVQERITKRMVAFGDVEEIFKRITSAGGIFYNMQEVQAETLAGMMSNLQDTFDIMFNEIGKANDGTLKNFVTLLKNIVNNWELIAQITLPIISLWIARWGILKVQTNLLFGSLSKFITVSTVGLRSIVAQLAGATVKARALRIEANKLGASNFNVWVTALTIVAGIILEIRNHIIAARKEQEELNKISAQGQFDALDLSSNYERLASVVSDATASYEEQDQALKELKRTYGDILPAHLLEAEAIRNLKGDYEEATKAIFDYVAAKTRERQLNLVAENQGEEISNSAQAVADGLKKYVKNVYNADISSSRFLSILALLRKEFEEGKITVDNYEERFKELIEDYTGIQNIKLPKAYRGTTSVIEDIFGFAPKGVKENLQEYIKNIQDYAEQVEVIMSESNVQFGGLVLNNLKEQKKAVDTQIKEVLSAYNVLDAAQKKDSIITPEQIKDAKNKINDFYKSVGAVAPKISDVINNAITIKDETIRVNTLAYNKFINEIKNTNIPKKDFGISFKFIEDIQKSIESLNGTDLQKKVRGLMQEFSALNNVELDGFEKALANSTDSTQTYVDRMSKLLKSLKEEWALLNVVGSLTYGTKTKEEMAQMENLIKFLEDLINKNTIAKGKKGESDEDKRLKRQISLLKEVGKEYEKNLKYYSKQEAISKTRKDYTDTFKEAGMGDMIMSMSFDPSGIINGIEEVGKQASKKMRIEVERAISGIQSEVDLDVRVKEVDSLRDELDKAFSGYELSIQLEGLGLDKNVLNNLFDIDYSSLDDLKEKLNKTFPDITTLSQEQFKVYKYFQNKISDAEQKEYEKRLKKFSEYIANSVDKVKQVQNSGALEISFATDFFNKGKLDAEQYATIIKNVTDKVNKEVSKINLDKFKETPEYIQAMGDLSAYSASQLEAMIARIQQLINESAGNLNASDLKVYTDLIDKMNERLREVKSPFQKGAFAEFRQIIKLQKEFNKEQENYNRLLEERKIAEQRLESAKAELENARNKVGIDASAKDDLVSATEELQDANDALNSSNDKLKISQGNLSGISNKLSKITGMSTAALAAVDRIVTGIYQSINATLDLMNQFKDLAESKGVDVNKGAWREVAQAGELLGNVNERVMSSWNNFKNLNFAGAVADAVGSITSVFTTLNKQHDARREQTIQEEIKQVEKLQKAYERLGDAISNAYTIDTLNASNENAQRNIQQQIQSYQNMIAAEEDKKDTDWDRIDEWKEAITDLQEQAADSQNQKIAGLGGFGSGSDMASAAQSFAEAWLDAYQETGDGLDALEGKWNEYINNIIAKQLALRGIEKFLEPVMKMVDEAIGNDSYLSTEEMAKIKDAIDKTVPEMNDLFKTIYSGFEGLIPDAENEDNGTTMSRGITSVTEETANVIEAYLNSMRYFVADSNMILNNLYAAFMSTDPLLNPMFSELSNQTKLLRSIDDRLSSVITYSGDHPNGGASIKVLT